MNIKLAKIWRNTLTLGLVMMLGLAPHSVCFAKTMPITSVNQFVGEGYTLDGIHYSIYLNEATSTESSDVQTIIKRKHSLTIIYDGKVDPPKVLRNQKITIDGVTYKGDLYLKYASYEPKSVLNPTGAYTSATYQGLLYANI